MKTINTHPSDREIKRAVARLRIHSSGRQVLQKLLPLVGEIGSMQQIDVEDVITIIYGANTFDISTPKWIKQAIEISDKPIT